MSNVYNLGYKNNKRGELIMGIDDLSKFLDDKEQKAKATDVAWGKRKSEWLTAVDNLYQMIEAWLKPLKDQGKVQTKHEKITLREEGIGAYEIKNMKLNFSGEIITFEPLGANILGARGRIDIKGNKKSFYILLTGKDSDGTSPEDYVWKLAQTPKAPLGSRKTYLIFDENLFTDTIKAILS